MRRNSRDSEQNSRYECCNTSLGEAREERSLWLKICKLYSQLLHTDYIYHFSRSRLRWTIGLVNIIATARPVMVKTNWALLKLSLKTSNVFDGATRERNMSRPKAKTNEVDSNRAGAVTMCRTLATWISSRIVRCCTIVRGEVGTHTS